MKKRNKEKNKYYFLKKIMNEPPKPNQYEDFVRKSSGWEIEKIKRKRYYGVNYKKNKRWQQ